MSRMKYESRERVVSGNAKRVGGYILCDQQTTTDGLVNTLLMDA